MKLQFQPHQWHTCNENDFRICCEGVNCYSYALNRPDFYWSVPGLGFAHRKAQDYFDSFNRYFKEYSIESFREKITQGALKDGLVRTDSPLNNSEYYSVALVFPESDHDFHWYRLDDDGLWSHKDGWRQATNKDDAGKNITDPRQATSNYYPVFGGFFKIPRSGIILAEEFPC